MSDLATTSKGHADVRILVVIVLYKLLPEESHALASVLTSLAHSGDARKSVQILLFDNTNPKRQLKNLPDGVIYVAAERNEGISGAYNFAMDFAASQRCTWLLTMDQDSTVKPDFIQRMFELAVMLTPEQRIGVITPRLMEGGRPLSPMIVRSWGSQQVKVGLEGVADCETHAFNSASLFRVAALKAVGGFSRYFWLDYADAWIFRQLFVHGWQVYVAGGVCVEHELSLLNMGQSMSPERFANILGAEAAFIDMQEGALRGLLHTGRLFFRIRRQRQRGDDPRLTTLTKQMLVSRITTFKHRRIADWKSAMEARWEAPVSSDGLVSKLPRPAISVCIAAYNGERFISSQLNSILRQLGPSDQIVVVDDHSQDETAGIVAGFNDSRIQILRHKTNLGVSQSFEDAIQAASNAIIFLSDQDDLWVEGKVNTILDAFARNPKVMLIATDAAAIDADGLLTAPSFFGPRGSFSAGFWANLVRNRFCGCTMAFRAEIKPDILPFPHQYDVLHDLWIGVRNTLAGHKTLYLDEPLVLYRRHESTVTGRKTLSTWRRIRNRLHLLIAIIRYRGKGRVS